MFCVKSKICAILTEFQSCRMDFTEKNSFDFTDTEN